MMKSMRTRLVCISTMMIVLSIVLFLVMNICLLPRFYEYSKKHQMNNVYSQVCKVFEENSWDENDTEKQIDIYDSVDKIRENSGVSLYVMQIKANVNNGDISEVTYLYPSMSGRMQDLNLELLRKYVQFKQIGSVNDENYEVLEGNDQYEMFRVYDKRVDSRYIDLVGGLQDKYWIYIRNSYSSINESAYISNKFIIYVGVFVTILFIAIMVFVSAGYTKPILRLAKIARQMEKLEFDVRYTDDRKDEIGVLGHSMNSLSDKLEETISELKTANNELQKDLEKRSEQEEMRKEFIANVSHELKTPIALIQGYAEGLKENINDDSESRDFYCEVIMDEAEKMSKMVKNLLELNQLEFGNGVIQLEHFDIQEVVSAAVNSVDIIVKQKNVKLLYEKNDPIYVWADEYMIADVITNYISNALNHVSGENVIEVKVVDGEEKVRVSVFNTGEKIPREDIGKIWEKFYKVDKARTREYGGNGIGLSIVKAVMEALNQEYGVENYDNGVEFWFELDKTNGD